MDGTGEERREGADNEERRSAPPLPETEAVKLDTEAAAGVEEPESTTEEMAADKPAASNTSDAAEAAAAVTADAKATDDALPKPPNRFQRLLGGYWHHKRWTLPLTLVVLITAAAVIPWTRYHLAGLVLKQDYTVVVVDSTTRQPVSNAVIAIDDVSSKTDNQGTASLHVSVGRHTLKVSKKYYRDGSKSVLVPIGKQHGKESVQLVATGRQVAVTVINWLNGTPVENAQVRVADTEARTDKDGKVTIVLPADKATLPAKFSAAGYNDDSGTIQVTGKTTELNTFQLTPAGKVYFLSNASGTIDVVKTNLDGTDRSVVLAGTGTESDDDTILLASRDWKYLALKSSRNKANTPQMYLIDTTNHDKLTTFDSSNSYFTPIGWYNNHFVYITLRKGIENWQPAAQVLKTYDAAKDKLVSIDQTEGEGTGPDDYAHTYLSSPYILHDEVVYTKIWEANTNQKRLEGKSDSLISAKPDGSSMKTIKNFAIPAGTEYSYYVALLLAGPDTVYVQTPVGDGFSYFSYEDGTLKAKNISSATFYKRRPTYLVSPNEQQTFWGEPRDGKNTLFVGDVDGRHGKQIASLTPYTPYGWYTDDYVLLSKDGSELAIMPVGGGQAHKITDYNRPGYDYRGYGYGYGGL